MEKINEILSHGWGRCIKNWFVYGVIAVLSVSCNRFLDEKSDARLVTPSSLKDLQALLDDAVYMNNKTTPAYGETSSDDYFVNDIVYGSMYVDQQHYYLWQKYDYRYSNDWSKGYLPVYNANLCLELLDNIPRSVNNSSQWDNVKGSALFFRSYYMTLLLWNYAKAFDSSTSGQDLGIVLRRQSDFNVPSQRESVENCYKSVLDDANESLHYLPDFPLSLYRPSKIAGYALLSRIYLSMRNYGMAKKFADSCLLFKQELMDLNGDSDINGSVSSNVPFKLFNKETIFYSEMTTGMFLASPSISFVDTTLYASYDVNDLRKDAYFRASGNYFKFKGTYTGSYYVYFTGLSVDEVLLIRAECHVRMGALQECCEDMDALLSKRIRKSAFVPLRISDPDRLLDTVLMERRKELLMRGLRWMDIKRLNKEGRNIVPKRHIQGKDYILPSNDGFYALPLPADVVELTGISQN